MDRVTESLKLLPPSSSTKHRALRFILSFALLFWPLASAANEPTAGADSPSTWPQFRGPGATGLAPGPAPPTSWNVKTGENILWRVEVPGLGHSCPVVWGDLLFITTSFPVDESGQELKVGLYGDIAPVKDEGKVYKWQVLAFDRHSGERQWQHTASVSLPATGRHPKSSYANSTPAVDGSRVIAFFGSKGIHALSHQGQELWKVNFGVLDGAFYRAPDAQWGFGSSPVLYEDKVIVQADVEGDSFVAALSAADGTVLWKTPRDEVATWGSPTVARVGDREIILVNGHKHLGAYDLASGKEVWRRTSLSDIPIPTPFVSDGVAYFAGSHGAGKPIYAVQLEAQGNLEEPTVAERYMLWSKDDAGSYMPTPIVVGDLLFVVNDQARVEVWNKKSGEAVGKARLERGAHTASPVAADGLIYAANEEGDVNIFRADGTLEKVGAPSIADRVLATPALVDGVLYVRGQRFLTAIGARPEEEPTGEGATPK